MFRFILFFGFLFLIIFYTDQVTGENIASNATDYWARLVQPCVETETRWVSVFGNHGKFCF